MSVCNFVRDGPHARSRPAGRGGGQRTGDARGGGGGGGGGGANASATEGEDARTHARASRASPPPGCRGPPASRNEGEIKPTAKERGGGMCQLARQWPQRGERAGSTGRWCGNSGSAAREARARAASAPCTSSAGAAPCCSPPGGTSPWAAAATKQCGVMLAHARPRVCVLICGIWVLALAAGGCAARGAEAHPCVPAAAQQTKRSTHPALRHAPRRAQHALARVPSAVLT